MFRTALVRGVLLPLEEGLLGGAVVAHEVCRALLDGACRKGWDSRNRREDAEENEC